MRCVDIIGGAPRSEGVTMVDEAQADTHFRWGIESLTFSGGRRSTCPSRLDADHYWAEQGRQEHSAQRDTGGAGKNRVCQARG